jgi:hypothetical protein
MRPLFDIVAEVAAGQQGRVTFQDLLGAGVDRDRIKRWTKSGLLRQVHHGVYAVGHEAPSWHADLMSAVLACGDRASASHGSAGYLSSLIRALPTIPHVTVPTTAGRRRPGIVVHRVKQLHPLDTDTSDGIPCTSVPRTLLDLAASLPPPQLARACHEAWIHHRTTPQDVEACIKRSPRKPGARRLRAAIGADVTLSDLEDEFLALLKRHRLPLPRTNVDRRGDKVDCHWPGRDLTVELLSYRFHGSRHAFEQDVARRRRSNHVAFTYGDVFERAGRTAAELAAYLR